MSDTKARKRSMFRKGETEDREDTEDTEKQNTEKKKAFHRCSACQISYRIEKNE